MESKLIQHNWLKGQQALGSPGMLNASFIPLKSLRMPGVFSSGAREGRLILYPDLLSYWFSVAKVSNLEFGFYSP